MENDLISRSALLEKQECVGISDAQGNYYGYCNVVFTTDIITAPAVDAVEAIKSTEEIEQALSILNIYRNSYYAEPSGTVKYAVANAINTILPLFVKCLERKENENN